MYAPMSIRRKARAFIARWKLGDNPRLLLAMEAMLRRLQMQERQRAVHVARNHPQGNHHVAEAIEQMGEVP